MTEEKFTLRTSDGSEIPQISELVQNGGTVEFKLSDELGTSVQIAIDEVVSQTPSPWGYHTGKVVFNHGGATIEGVVHITRSRVLKSPIFSCIGFTVNGEYGGMIQQGLFRAAEILETEHGYNSPSALLLAESSINNKGTISWAASNGGTLKSSQELFADSMTAVLRGIEEQSANI